MMSQKYINKYVENSIKKAPFKIKECLKFYYCLRVDLVFFIYGFSYEDKADYL